MKIGVGDLVRVFYHPPAPRRSFAEGVVSRIDVQTLAGHTFVFDVTKEVLFDREQPIRSGYQNYVLYERGDEFPGRVEVLSKDEFRSPAHVEQVSDLQEEQGIWPDSGTEQAGSVATEDPSLHEPETEAQSEEKPSEEIDLYDAEVDRPVTPLRTSLISALFRR